MIFNTAVFGGSGGGTTKTVEVTLSSPKHASMAKDPACILYEADDPFFGERTQIGSISSPSGSTTVTMTKPALCAIFFSDGYIATGSANGLYGVYDLADSTEDGNAFFVCGDGYAYVSGVDYDD